MVLNLKFEFFFKKKVNTAKTICLAMQREYSEYVQQQIQSTSTSTFEANRIDRTCAEFLAIKELAHRFCLSFGPEASVKSREAIVAIHMEAIKYALESRQSSLDSSQASSNANNNNNFKCSATKFSFSRMLH
jgi:hypothetical protein